MMCHQHKQPPKLKELAPETPDDMVAVVERLMQKTPQERFADCREVMEALRPLAAVATQPVRRSMSMPRVVLPRGGIACSDSAARGSRAHYLPKLQFPGPAEGSRAPIPFRVNRAPARAVKRPACSCLCPGSARQVISTSPAPAPSAPVAISSNGT